MQKIFIFIILFFIFCLGFILVDKYLVISTPIVKPLVKPIIKKVEKKQPYLSEYEQTLANSSDLFYNETLVKSGFNGSILVTKGDKIIYERYHGLTEIDKGIEIDSTVSFHLASVSKTFTAMGILKLSEQNKLSIDDSVTKYLPTFPYKDITIKNLLSQRSGLPNYVNFIESTGWNTKELLSNESLLSFLNSHARKIGRGKPNSNFDYSNTNYALLALIIEKITNLKLPIFLNETFFKPLGMNHTFVYTPDKQDSVLPSFKENNQKEEFTFLDAVYGDKNVYSTTRDMMKWDLAISNGKMFTANTLIQAFQGYSHEKKGIKNYGLGWRLFEMPSGKKIIFHNGWWHGNNTFFNRFPDDTTTIIVLGNKYNERIYEAKKIISFYPGYGFESHEE